MQRNGLFPFWKASKSEIGPGYGNISSAGFEKNYLFGTVLILKNVLSNIKGMKVLVLGGNGFIGSHLVDRLLREGHEVHVFDRQPERYRTGIDAVKYYMYDFGNRAVLASALKDIDMVFHLVSTTSPKTSNDDPEFDVMSNLVETISLLRLCVAEKVKRFVFVSSGGAIYGTPLSLPVSEDCPKHPLSSYGVTKLAIESYIELFHHLYGLDYVVIRPSNPYGERQNPLGDQGVIAVFLGKIAKNLPIEIWGDGNAIKDYIYIEDLIDGIYKAAFFKAKHCIFNIGSGTGCSINDIIRVIGKTTDAPISINYRLLEKFDVQKTFLDISRAKKELSWEPRVFLTEGIARTWKFIREICEK